MKKVFNFIYFLLWFVAILILLGILCIYYYFPEATFNQIFFHILYIDWQQLSFWWLQILGILILSILIAFWVCKRHIALLIPVLLFLYIFFHPLKVSNVEEDKKIPIFKQLLFSLEWSSIYEKYYQIPQMRELQNPKNIIFIFAESMEDNFADEKYWGENLIPYLSKLKEEGISFDDYEPINGTNWTLASNISAFCGVPLRMHLRDRLGTETKQFMPNIKCLPDILKSIGYYNVFSTSTYSAFVGTDTWVDEHSFDELYGRDELILENHASAADIGMAAFGINDKKIFEFARKKISTLAEKHSPFFISIQTVDTHFPNGYVHDSCSRKYGDTRDAIKCSDKTIYDFIRWAQEQDFYDNTIIVIVGDHLMMTTTTSDIAYLAEGYPDRQIYNVILEKDVAQQIIKKKYSMMDIGATVASKAGILSNDNFGLGVSLFSDKKTLTEKLGPQKFEEEISKNSSMYNYFLGVSSRAKHKYSQNKVSNLKLSKSKMIAHAGGSIDGNIYTNSLEALNISALRGYKYIEIDLLPLFDKQQGFLGAHDYLKFKNFVKEPCKFDRKTIKNLKILGKYTPLTDDVILDFFEKHPDMWLVTDKVYDLELLNEKFGKIKDRMIIELWNKKLMEEAKKYGFNNLAYTLNNVEDIPLVLSNDYKFVAVPLEFLQKYEKTIQKIRQKKGVKVMVYTLKDKTEVLEYDNFADMIYYDGEENIEE